VQFKDTTEECTASRLWEFGDGEESTDPYTSHTYIYPGTYVATLSVTFCNGYENPAAFEQIHVESIIREDSYITGFKNATILPGGVFNFILKNNANLRVGGRWYTLQENDAVKLELSSSGQGAITVIGNVIIDLVLPEAILFVNGEEITKGSITQSNGIPFSSFAVSELSLYISPGQNAEINGSINGYNVISPNTEYEYFIHNIGPDSTGKMIIDAKDQKFVLQAGMKGITQVTSG
jgi:PKD repeat protein